jgi:AmiR/NasT family two-component response regulator
LARRRDVLNEQLQAALTGRIAIEQAKGALSGHLNVTTGEAFEVLRSRARSSQRRLGERHAEQHADHDLERLGPLWPVAAA